MADIHHLSGASDRRFDTEDLAKRWRCSVQTVRGNRAKWGLKGMRFGKRLLFTEEEVLAAEKRRARETR